MFKELSQMLADGQTLALTVMKYGNKLSVAVLPQNELVKDTAKDLIVPLTITGSAEELDAGFITSITRPVTAATELLANMAEFDKALQKTNDESKATKEKASRISKIIKEAEDLEKADKVPEALVLYKKALELDGNNQKIKAKINDLANSMAQIDLFAEDVKAATQTIPVQIPQPEPLPVTEPEPQTQRDMFAEIMGITENKPIVIPELIPSTTIPPEPVQSAEIDMALYRQFLEFKNMQESIA